MDQAVHFQQDIPEDRGADQEDEMFHNPVNVHDPNPDPLTVPECTPPTFDPGRYIKIVNPILETQKPINLLWTLKVLTLSL